MVDMHVHTNRSDGDHSPSEVVQMAHEVGITHLAISDHDTIDGLKEAHAKADELGLKLLNGVELASREYKNMHILGYGFNYDNPLLNETLTKWINGRVERCAYIISFLKEYHNIELSLDYVKQFCEGKSIGRVHFSQALMSLGYVDSIKEAFVKYFDTPEFHAHDRKKPTTERILDVIQGSGGMAVLAHPSSLGIPDDEFDRLIARMKSLGLTGLECYYCKHDRAMTEKYIAVAKKYDLLITGGSDFHGDKAKPNLKIGTGYDNTFHYDDIETFEKFYNHQENNL
jgi:predicted metal-dependent phosphoesterase TrpH